MSTRTPAWRTAAGLLAAGLVVGLAPAASAHPDHGGGAVSDGVIDNALAAHEQHEGEGGHLPPVNRNVELVGKLEIPGVLPGEIADVAAFGNTAYLASFRPACDRGAGVYTVDISDPAAPRHIGFIPTSQGSYVGEGVHVIDVDNAFFTGQLLLFNNETCPTAPPAGTPRGGMTVVDVTNPAAPVVLAAHVGDNVRADGTTTPFANVIHSVFGWTHGPNIYAVLVDNVDNTDLDIMDITDPRAPRLMAEYDLNDFDIAQPELGDGSSFLHDMVVKDIDGVQTMLASYWDGGYVQLDVTNPLNATLINQTDFTVPDPERAKRGEQVLPEGNAHQAEYTRDNRFFVGTDEDFSPYKLAATMEAGREFRAQPGSGYKQVEPGQTVTGPTVFLGEACGPVQQAEAAGQVGVVERGGCTFQAKADNLAAAGYETGIVFNSKSGGDAIVNMGGTNPAIRFSFISRSDGLRILNSFDEAKPSTEQDAPAIGTKGQTVTFRSFFDGWGYVHLYDRTTAVDVGTYAVPESQDPAFAQGFGDLSVHEVATDPDQDISYLSYYGAGLRIISQGGRGLQEIGAFIDQGGNNFWGVEVHQSPSHGKVLLASDRDYGLYVFRYARPAAAARPINDSCPDGRVPASRFSDLPSDDVHALAVRCADWYDIADGYPDGTFRHKAGVTRGAMASFIGRTILRGGGTLPENPPDRFADDNGSVHERFINRLAAAGVVQGLPDGRYGADEVVSRGQMATFLSRAYRQVTGTDLPAQSDFFDDDKESTHEVNINRVAGAGIAQGVSGTTFAPLAGTQRGQMSTFLARLLDVLVEEGKTTTP